MLEKVSMPIMEHELVWKKKWMNLALATFSNSYSYAKKLSGQENRKLAKFHLQVVVIAIKGLDCTWPKSPPFSQFLIRLPPLCVFHHFPLFNWVWWWSWIFSVKMQSNRILSWFVTSYWFSSGAPNHLTAVNNVTLELKSHVPNNHCSSHHRHQKNDVFGFASILYASENLDLLKRIRKQLTKQILPHVGVSDIVIVLWPWSSSTSEKPLMLFCHVWRLARKLYVIAPFCTRGAIFRT